MRRSAWVSLGAAVVAIGALTAGAVFASGYSVVRPPRTDASVWVLKGQGAAARYAEVNTDLGELQLVRSVDSPSGVVQGDGRVLVYAHTYSRVASIDPADPANLSADELTSTPAGTSRVVSAGDYVGYLTAGGQVYAGRVSETPALVQPSDGYTSDAIAVSPDGTLLSYSHAAGGVLRFDLPTRRVTGTDPVPGGPTSAGSSLTAIGDAWALLDATGGRLWLKGLDAPVETGLGTDARLQQSAAEGASVAIADGSGLYSFDLATGARTGLAAPATVGAVPAAPVVSGGVLYAAWLPQTGPSGTLWSSADGTTSLDYGGLTLSAAPTPVFRSNGSRLVLNDAQSGWAWRVPDGALVTGSQNWEVESDRTRTDENADQVDRVTTPRPPVAVDDAFGVRAGALVTLPVLLNDYDANDDVIQIDPGSVTQPGFAKVSVTDDGQTLTASVAPGATGAARFTYRVSDGALTSRPATVTLTVHGDETNAAPAWCGVDRCLATWPAPEVAPGGTVTIPFLDGWVDPDGDPLFVADATPPAVGSLTADPDGDLVYQAPDGADEQTVSTVVTVSDVRGETTRKSLQLRITGSPDLSLTPFSVMTTAGQPVTVDPSEHLAGAVGATSITSVTAPSGADVQTAIDGSGATFTARSAEPGSYTLTVAVRDGEAGTTAEGVVRVTVLPKGTKLLTTSPVTVFVRPNADTSVDVFSAVSNPSGAVLLLSDAVAHPAAGVWSFSATAVAESQLRVTGQTADGQAGELGTISYTVSDGTGDPDYTASGVATAYLLPAARPARPIAVSDTARVRVGEQIDIPVLANDVAPAGNTVQLDPSSVTGDGGLAFGSGSLVRYLAPTRPGTYTLRYRVYTSGHPSYSDTADVTVTVVPDGGNRPPQPVSLTARVLSGSTVRIPFDGFGLDPDGDRVALSRIVTQPAQGVATISATGDAIVYTAEASTATDAASPVSFDYEVRDAYGDTGVAQVRVGVLSSQVTDPAPITFSDYVQVQAGEGNKVVVQPAANDIDPAGGALKLIDVKPFAPEGTAQYAEFAAHLPSGGATDSGAVTITAPAADSGVAVLDYQYTVANETGDESTGLIVVRVVAEPVPDYPVVRDTVVPLEQRDALPDGIDVVTGAVSWTTGDASSLRLSLVRAQDGVTVDGRRIAVASVPDAGLLVPFRLTGTSFAGQQVRTYGFLRVPSKDDVVLALRADAGVQSVREDESVSFDMARLVTVPAGEQLAVQAAGVKASGARAAARCTARGTVVTYSAGEGAPWQDTCVVPVRFSGQARYTVLAVPIQVISPEPVLRPASVTANPGGPAVAVDLANMTTWQGSGDVATLRYAVAYPEQRKLFDVTLAGRTLTVRAKDASTPGLEQRVWISLPDHPSSGSAAITLKVGVLPAELPAGASVSATCHAADGSCTVPVAGVAGEQNPFPGTPLRVTAVEQSAECQAVRFAVAGRGSVRATWAADTAGGICSTVFTVADAQGRTGTGTLDFDLRGLPTAPDSVTQTGYGDGSVTLTVSPGGSTAAWPALRGFHLYQDGVRLGVDCSPSGQCPAITGLVNGQKHTYRAVAFNSEGESATDATTQAWSYRPPAPPQVTSVRSVYDAARTSATRGVIELHLATSDRTTTGYDVQVAGGDSPPDVVADPSGATTATFATSLGAQSLTITPTGSIERPPGTGPTVQSTTATVTVYGSPGVTAQSADHLAVPDDTTIAVTGSPATRRGSDKPDDLEYVAVPGGGGSPCSASDSGTLAVAGGAVRSGNGSSTISGLNRGTTYAVYVCYSNGYGAASDLIGTVLTIAAPHSGDYTYTITNLAGPGDPPDYEGSATGPAPGSGYVVRYSGDADATTGAIRVWGQVPHVSVRYCLASDPSQCSAATSVSRSGGAPYQLRLPEQPALQCSAAGALSLRYSHQYINPADLPDETFENVQYYDSAGNPLPAGSDGIASVTADWTMTWSDAGFDPYSVTGAAASCG